ncbi:MAG: PKD domain-containing protein [Thermoplasmata archaeon]|nr:PKD domain-containing protein [Thermoplasmata archaeon]
MQRRIDKRVTLLPTIFVIILLFTSIVPLPVKADDPTLVQVSPSNTTVSALQTFSLNINCIPSQPIKAFELKISFNPSLLQANSVTKGTIFSGHTTFFNNGTIDNSAGTIINVYNLIVGSGNISNPGTLVTISFTAKTFSGTSPIDLYDVGVTDELGYVSITVSDASVTVNGENQPPIFSSASPTNGSTGVSIGTTALTILIRDLEGDVFNWSITTSPNIGSNAGTTASNGTKSCSISGLSYSTTYHWYVVCKDVGSNHWRNASYWFTTVAESQGGNPPGGGGGTPGGGEPPFEPEQNLPPNVPVQPIGPTFIERGIWYEYTSYTYDLNGDQVRLRFDWGDGNFSDWSDLVDSNMTVSASHIWDNRSTFSVRVIAQDENGSNSSWSDPLTVTVSEETGGIPPVLDIIAPGNGSANQTILFDVSVSVGPDSEIISYSWDFGDGTTGTGKTPSHMYTKPGVYSVVLTVLDNTGKTNLKTFLITIGAGAKTTAQNQESPFSYLAIVLILGLCIGLFIYFRKKLLKIFSDRLVFYHERKIEHLSTKIADMGQRVEPKPVMKYYVSDNRKKLSKSIDTSIEEQVDHVLLSKIEEEIDRMQNHSSLYCFYFLFSRGWKRSFFIRRLHSWLTQGFKKRYDE